DDAPGQPGVSRVRLRFDVRLVRQAQPGRGIAGEPRGDARPGPDRCNHPAPMSPDIQPILDRIAKASRPAFIMSTAAVRGSCAADVGDVALRLGAPVL